MADAPTFNETARWLAETLTAALSQSVQALTSEAPSIEWKPCPLAAPGESGDWLWWEQPISGAKEAVFWSGIPGDSWRSLGKLALAGAGIDDATDEDCLGTWRELQSQTLSGGAQALSRRLRKDVGCEAGRDLPSAPTPPYSIEIVLGISDVSHRLRIGWSSALQGVLDPDSTSSAAPASSSDAARATRNAAPEAPKRADGGRTLDLLLEVELPVSVSFGRAQLPLKDVLKLNSGSIVELNRSINEPVEVIVNNCVVARGEVVVVEGNYGVRIKQIVSREERLRTLY